MGFLEHLKYNKCPHCGSDIKEKRQGSQHCNGQFNEWIDFWCGHSIHYSPNFRMEETRYECPKEPKVFEKLNKRESAKIKIRKYIEKMKDVDDKFKEKAINEIGELNINFK